MKGFLVAAALTAAMFGWWSAAFAAPDESRLTQRADGTFAAIPEIHGTTKTFRIVSRIAPWQLKPGLTVREARTYNGVVPGPTLVVSQGDHVVIDYTNEMEIPDTIHLHGIHGAPVGMDGVAGISQHLVPPKGHFRYAFVANQDGTFIYHSHGSERIVDAGLYGAIIVEPARPRSLERGLSGDYVEMISAWQVESDTENHFTLNGKEYPATQPIEVRRGDRVRIRWINISSENEHTMHTHGHDQRVIARDARPVPFDDEEDTVLLGPGQRADVVLAANAKPGTWIVHCHFLDHVMDPEGMPEGLITAVHYRNTPEVFGAMDEAMHAEMPMRMPAKTSASSQGALGWFSRRWQIAIVLMIGILVGMAATQMRRRIFHG